MRLDDIYKAKQSLLDNDASPERGKRLLCYDSEADRLIAAGLLTEADVIRIKPLPLS